jgi:hypothetical protein
MNTIVPTPTMLRNAISSLSAGRTLFRAFSSSVKDLNKKRIPQSKYDLNAEADKVVDEYYKITKISRGQYNSIQDYLMSQSENDYFHEQALKHAFKN